MRGAPEPRIKDADPPTHGDLIFLAARYLGQEDLIEIGGIACLVIETKRTRVQISITFEYNSGGWTHTGVMQFQMNDLVRVRRPLLGP